MSQSFIACDREQAMLLPPSLLDWVPADHLVWTILGSVAELDLDAFYGVYRRDGHGRPAYDPAMMVALLLYAYSNGHRSSRGIERKCREDVAFMVICARRVPDHSTIAEFRRRHETALAGLFSGVLKLCKEAGLVKVGVIAIDGTKMSANAGRDANKSYRRIVHEILEEAEQVDLSEDEQHGDRRGDELPEEMQTPEGRRAAFRAAKQRLDRRDDSDSPSDDSSSDGGGGRVESEVAADGDGSAAAVLKFDADAIVARANGRDGWLQDARRQLTARRERDARAVPWSRGDRLLESARRLEEDHAGEVDANRAYERFRATGRDTQGRRLSRAPKPYQPPAQPEGRINTTDPDSRVMKTAGQPGKQGYNAQAAVNENQIIIAAEIADSSPDFGNLELMVAATERELLAVGVNQLPGVVVADPGYWHTVQMEGIVSRGMPVLVPPESRLRDGTRAGWDGGYYAFMRRVLDTDYAQAIYKKRQATIEPVFGQIKHNRGIDRFQRRGRSAVRSEWRLAAATHNLLKLHTHRAATAGP
jgi:transposase